MPRAKPITRRTLLSRRDALTADARAEASPRVCERARSELTGRSIVALYATKGSEVDTESLDTALRAAGATVAYPRIVDGERVLAFHAAALADLEPGRLGLREPRTGAPAIELSAIDAFCIPGVAFDPAGWRIGWGRGHYDATLTAAPVSWARRRWRFDWTPPPGRRRRPRRCCAICATRSRRCPCACCVRSPTSTCASTAMIGRRCSACSPPPARPATPH